MKRNPVFTRMQGAFAAARGNEQAPPYYLTDAMVNYENGELFGTVTVNASPESVSPDGLSIFLASAADPSAPTYCEGLVGPPMSGSIQLGLPMSISTATQSVTLPNPTTVEMTVVITYNGTQQQVITQTFPVPPTE